MPDFKLVSDFKPTGDQPEAIRKLAEGLRAGYAQQTLLGATGTGKTYVMASLVEALNRPTLVMAHNKTLAAQLYSEFKEFFPHNAVEYFVSYYDYYQPEAYLPRTDTYIEKDSQINDEIDRLRLAATSSLLSRRDVLIVASVSCIYGLGDPAGVRQRDGQAAARRRRCAASSVLRQLVDIYYERNDMDLRRGKFRVRGDTLEVQPAYAELAYRVEFFGDEVERITEIDPLTGEVLRRLDEIEIFPAKHFVTPQEKLTEALQRHRGRDGGAAQALPRAGQAAGGAAAGAAHALRPGDDARGGLLLRHRELQPAAGAAPARVARRGRCSTTSPTISCWSSTSRT